MVNIKRQKLKAYILLESLIALGLLAMITSVVLGEIDKNSQSMQESLRQQEALNVATMAVQTGQNHLKMNGVEVEIVKKDGEIYVYEGKTEILHVKKD
ncbi:competence type IV pilus minor pilin ComGE [Streptococcus macedonicus]|uniref:competence type IV pilus minor pilin ComGE n=1 Tax=Streptococcus macedonicus TaxID=59310 RepID=UPI002ADDEFAC|nr:competence type IV pilus minor pilin ComGE [Streptococcus macedonicus]